jgi:hypothetical protein
MHRAENVFALNTDLQILSRHRARKFASQFKQIQPHRATAADFGISQCRKAVGLLNRNPIGDTNAPVLQDGLHRGSAGFG